MLNRLRFLALFVSTWLAVVTLPLFRRVFSLVLCGLLFANSSFCYNLLGNDMATAASSGLEEASFETTSDGEFLSPQEIAVPPIIREAPIDLQNALPDDFVVSRQTPYSSGRNEVLIVSPSTGTEQRFDINLPGTSGSFRLYQASFDKVVIDDPARVVGDESSLSPDQIQAKLESFTIKFDSNNSPELVILADGTEAEFANSEAVIRSADGQVIDTIPLSDLSSSHESSVSAKASENLLAQINPYECKDRIRNQLYGSGQKAKSISDALKNANSNEGKAFAWTLTYGKRALEDSLVANTRNQTLQSIACTRPVQCNQQERYEGSNVIRTDLFQLPGGRNQRVNIQYEFYEIEDRMEVYVEGRLIDSIPKGSGYTGGSGDVPLSIDNGIAFLGIKLIGNEDSGTKWWYTISCSGESVPQELLEAREIANRLSDVYPEWKKSLDSCPCTRDEARNSDRFTRSFLLVQTYHPGADTAYRSAEGAVEPYYSQILPGAAPLYPGQQCTYDDTGMLITGGIGAGTPDAYSPEVASPIWSSLHPIWDVEPAKAMSWQEYQQTWTPNNGNSCPVNVK